MHLKPFRIHGNLMVLGLGDGLTLQNYEGLVALDSATLVAGTQTTG
jgi:hypothetical protein